MAAQSNIKAAEQTYHSFVGLMKWGTIGCVLVTVLVIALIV